MDVLSSRSVDTAKSNGTETDLSTIESSVQNVKLPHVGPAREAAKLESGAWLRPTARALELAAAAAERSRGLS